MANMFTIKKNNIKLLDPGAGTGNLTAAFCQRLLKSPNRHSITVDVYENDSDLIPALENVLNACKTELNNNGQNLQYNIYEEDFVLHNKEYLERESPPFQNDLYDYVISNPPYYKLDKSSPQAIVMRKFISGHPNIYALFMILSTKMLRENGELVFITPRSFCSGMYYKKFRKWFLQNVHIAHLHTFESRREIFDNDQVLQENILIKATKTKANQEMVKVTSSKSKLFDVFNEIEVAKSDVIFHKNGDVFIRIPSSRYDVATLKLIDAWPNTLKDLGLEISTGPVVVFRTKENVQYKIEKTTEYVPLLWMHNFYNMSIKWPVKKKNKPMSIYVNEKTKPLLLPVKNYVLVKRFSSKEQRKRLYAAVLLKEDFPSDIVGIENHVNYIHKIDGELTNEETLGIAGLLNTSLIDNYFRSLNGNTQVNAVEIRSLPLPNMEQIREIGKRVFKEKASQIDLDRIVFEVLQINADMASICNKEQR
jgi:adenine-specific DNA-methyltransferase